MSDEQNKQGRTNAEKEQRQSPVAPSVVVPPFVIPHPVHSPLTPALNPFHSGHPMIPVRYPPFFQAPPLHPAIHHRSLPFAHPFSAHPLAVHSRLPILPPIISQKRAYSTHRQTDDVRSGMITGNQQRERKMGPISPRKRNRKRRKKVRKNKRGRQMGNQENDDHKEGDHKEPEDNGQASTLKVDLMDLFSEQKNGSEQANTDDVPHQSIPQLNGDFLMCRWTPIDGSKASDSSARMKKSLVNITGMDHAMDGCIESFKMRTGLTRPLYHSSDSKKGCNSDDLRKSMLDMIAEVNQYVKTKVSSSAGGMYIEQRLDCVRRILVEITLDPHQRSLKISDPDLHPCLFQLICTRTSLWVPVTLEQLSKCLIQLIKDVASIHGMNVDHCLEFIEEQIRKKDDHFESTNITLLDWYLTAQAMRIRNEVQCSQVKSVARPLDQYGLWRKPKESFFVNRRKVSSVAEIPLIDALPVISEFPFTPISDYRYPRTDSSLHTLSVESKLHTTQRGKCSGNHCLNLKHLNALFDGIKFESQCMDRRRCIECSNQCECRTTHEIDFCANSQIRAGKRKVEGRDVFKLLTFGIDVSTRNRLMQAANLAGEFDSTILTQFVEECFLPMMNHYYSLITHSFQQERVKHLMFHTLGLSLSKRKVIDPSAVEKGLIRVPNYCPFYTSDVLRYIMAVHGYHHSKDALNKSEEESKSAMTDEFDVCRFVSEITVKDTHSRIAELILIEIDKQREQKMKDTDKTDTLSINDNKQSSESWMEMENGIDDLSDTEGRVCDEQFPIYQKGVGLVCVNPSGISNNEFIVEYFGEVFAPHLWAERMEVREEVESKLRMMQELLKEGSEQDTSLFVSSDCTDFFNIILDRPRDDPSGFDTVHIDPIRFGTFGSRLSHSCFPNVLSVPMSSNGRLVIAMYALRDVRFGTELCFNYHGCAEKLREYCDAVCFCGTRRCKGSYLAYSGDRSDDSKKGDAKEERLLRNVIHLVKSVRPDLANVSSDEIRSLQSSLAKIGVGQSMMGDPSLLPAWLLGYVGYLSRDISVAHSWDSMVNQSRSLAKMVDRVRHVLIRQPMGKLNMDPLKVMDEGQVSRLFLGIMDQFVKSFSDYLSVNPDPNHRVRLRNVRELVTILQNEPDPSVIRIGMVKMANQLRKCCTVSDRYTSTQHACSECGHLWMAADVIEQWSLTRRFIRICQSTVIQGHCFDLRSLGIHTTSPISDGLRSVLSAHKVYGPTFMFEECVSFGESISIHDLYPSLLSSSVLLPMPHDCLLSALKNDYARDYRSALMRGWREKSLVKWPDPLKNLFSVNPPKLDIIGSPILDSQCFK